MRYRFLLNTALILLFGIGYSSLSFANQYESELVDNASIGEYGTDIALDSNGNAGICYYDAANQILKYAYDDGNDWATETVDNRGRDDKGQYCAVIFDDNDHPHIVYYNVTRGEILHARKVNRAWIYARVDNQDDWDIFLRATKRISIAKDTAGHIGIAYYDSTDRDLIFAEWDGNRWATETVESDGDVGRYPSLAYDTDNLPAIAAMKYTNASNAVLLYISHNGFDWQAPEIVAERDWSGAFNSLKFDSNNIPHVAYQAIDPNGIQSMNYTNKVGGEWKDPLTLNSGAARGASVGTFCEMAIGPDGDAHIIYRYYFFSALFGSAYYLRISHLYDVRQSSFQNMWVQTDNLRVSVAPRLHYAALALALDDNHQLVYSYGEENFHDRNYSLYSGRLASWSPMIVLLTPNAANRRADGDRMEITWTDFDPDSNAQIRFYTRDRDFNLVWAGETVDEDGANRYELNTSNLQRGSYSLLARISDDDFQTFSDSVPPDQFIVENRNPGRPTPAGPVEGERVGVGRPPLIFGPASDSDNDPLTYEVEIYADAGMNRLVLERQGIEGSGNEIRWVVEGDLADNTTYTWRVRSRDAAGATGPWSEPRSFSTFINNAPGVPVLREKPLGKGEGAATGEEEDIVLEIENSADEEGDAVVYLVQICADEACNEVIRQIENVDPDASGLTRLSIDPAGFDEGEYFWRAKAEDENGESSAWSAAGSFSVSGLKKGDSGADSGGEDAEGEDSGDDSGDDTEGGITAVGAAASGCHLSANGADSPSGFPVFILALLTLFVARCRKQR
ncbi:MAG: hypothetical protein HY541_02340 [Deltaproteobacteria bacterium]|nr:hypothetical protein [Deltaproteobacteria bacterium]